MKFLLETVSLCLLVTLVAVDAGIQHHFAKRNNIQIREIHVPHPRLRRVYLLEHASKESLNHLESHDNSEKDEVEVLPAKTKYDIIKQTTLVPHVEVASDTLLEIATTSLPNEELKLTTSVSDKELEPPNVTPSKEFELTSLSSDVKEPEVLSVVPNEEIKETSSEIKNPEISDKVPNKKIKPAPLSDVKEPELPKENKEQEILTEHHRKRRGVYYLNTQYENEKKVQTPLVLEDAVNPSKLEQSTLPPTTELHDETTPLSTDLEDKTKPDSKNPEKVIGEDKTKPESKNPIIAIEEIIKDDVVQKPSKSETEKPATENEKKINKPDVEKTVQEVEVKEEETVQRKKRDFYNINLKQKEDKSEDKKETLELNKPYVPLKTDTEKTSLLDDKLNKVETSTPKSEETVSLDIHKEDEEDLVNTEKTEQATSLDIKKKKQGISSETKQGIDSELKLEETTTLEPTVDQPSTLAEVEPTSIGITTIRPMPEEKPKVELSIEKRQKRDKYSFLEINKKLKVEENTLSSIDTTLKDNENLIKDEINILSPVIESLTSIKTNEKPKTENIPTITKTNYKKKNGDALLPVSEEEKETENTQKVGKLPAEIQTEDKQKPENSLDDNGSEEKTNEKKISVLSESENEKKETNHETELSQPSGEKAVEIRKKRNSYTYFPIKEEQKKPQLTEDESIPATTLENKVEEVTAPSVEKVTELNALTTAKEEVEQTSVTTEESMTTLKPKEKEQDKKETPIVKSRLRRNEYYNKLQNQPIKKEEIKIENAQPLKNEEIKKENEKPLKNEEIKKENEQPLKNEEIKKENEQPLKKEEDKLVDLISKPDESALSPQESTSTPAEPISQPSEEVFTLNSLLTTLSETNNLKALSEESTSIKNGEENTTELSEKNKLPQL